MNNSELLANERSEGSELIVEMNLLFDRKDWGMNSAVGELSLKTNSGLDNRNRTLFPDAVIFADKAKSETLMGWEFKMPDVPIDDAELLSNAMDKANRMGTQVFVLWNFQYAAVYIKDKESGSWPLSPTKFFDEYKDIMLDRTSVHANSNVWKKQLYTVLSYLNGELSISKFTAAPIEFNIASYVSTIADKLAPTVAKAYLKSADTMLMAWMKRWRLKEQAELTYVKGNESDETIANAFARNVVIRWVNRLIFAHLLKQDQNLINNALVDFSVDVDIFHFSDLLNAAVKTTDFYTILHVEKYENLLPRRVVDNLNEFNVYLAHTDFSKMSVGFVSQLLESVVSVTVRELMGLYTTPEPLAELLVGLTVDKATGEFADLTTGSGTIARAIQNLLRRYHDEEYVHNHVWASDRYSYPLQIANLNLTTPNSLNLKNIVFRHNALSLRVGETVEIVDPATGENTELKLPKFNYIVSNLPFVQSNDRNDEDQLYVDSVLNQFPELDDKTDLYQALILKLEPLLSVDNVAKIGVITSNSWMKVQKNYKSFFKTMAKVYDVEMIVQPSAGRWFQNADVMTTMIILNRKSESNPNTRLIMLKSGLTSTDGYRDKLPDLIDNIKLGDPNPLYSEQILQKSEIIRRLNLGMSMEAMFDNTNWLTALEDKLIPIANYLEGGRGTRTGGDPIFIMKENEVDDEYSIPYLKTPKEVTTYEIKESDYYYFYTKDSRDLLTEKGMSKTLSYLDRVKNSKSALTRREKKGERWFNADQAPQYADFFTSMNPNDRFFWGRMNPRGAVNQRLTAFRAKKEFYAEIDLLHAMLNSLPDLFMLAASGFGRGQGVTDLTKDGIMQTTVLNIELISTEDKIEIIQLWQNLKKKPVMSIKEQLNDPEWSTFNKKIFSVYDLDDETYELMKINFISLIDRRLSANKVIG